MSKELRDKERLKERIKGILAEFEDNGDKTKYGKERTVNRTDTESALMRSIHGSHASYNSQSVMDDKNGLIVNVDVVSEGTDVNQLSEQLRKAQEVTQMPCEVVCADAGYANTRELEKLQDRDIKIVVFWFTVKWTFIRFEINYLKWRKVYEKEETQVHGGGEGIHTEEALSGKGSGIGFVRRVPIAAQGILRLAEAVF